MFYKAYYKVSSKNSLLGGFRLTMDTDEYRKSSYLIGSISAYSEHKMSQPLVGAQKKRAWVEAKTALMEAIPTVHTMLRVGLIL